MDLQVKKMKVDIFTDAISCHHPLAEGNYSSTQATLFENMFFPSRKGVGREDYEFTNNSQNSVDKT